MANNLKKFSTESDYQSATLNYPAVSWVVNGDTVHFDKTAPTPQVAKAVAYFSNSDVVTIPYDGQTILTRLEIFGEDRLAEDLVAIEVGDSVTEIEGACFDGCTSLSSVSLTNSITTIGGGAFRETTSLQFLVMPSGVTYIANELFKNSGISDIDLFYATEIGQKAFRNCSSLTSVTTSDDLQIINSEAFKNCTSLTGVSIGTAITEIKSSVFEGCTNLESVTVYATTPPTLSSNYVFDGTSSNLAIYVPSESVETYKAAEGWSEYSDKIQAIA